MNIKQVTQEQIQERVIELVASIEQHARRAHTALKAGSQWFKSDTLVYASEDAALMVKLTTELATLLGKGRLIVERELGETGEARTPRAWEVSRES